MQPKPARLPPDSATILERSRGVFFAQWEELLLLKRAVLKTSELDDIHDLRVASRRFRAELDLFSSFTKKSSITELKKNVRKLTQTLGGLRNVDEALLFFQSRTPPDSSIDTTLCQAISGLRIRELKRIEKMLKVF